LLQGGVTLLRVGTKNEAEVCKLVWSYGARAHVFEFLVEPACNHPNCLLLLFKLELVQLAA
jgi:hypothetical protein